MAKVEAIQSLIDKYESLKESLPDGIEKLCCDIYIKVFIVCKRKARVDKIEKYARDEFNICDRKRLDFRMDDQTEDALIEALKQEAYRQVWRACELSEGVLIAQKHKVFREQGAAFNNFYGKSVPGRTMGFK